MNRQNTNSAFLLALFLAQCLPITLAQGSHWQETLEQGHKYFEEGNLSKAEELYVAAIAEAGEIAPKDLLLALALNDLATIHFVIS